MSKKATFATATAIALASATAACGGGSSASGTTAAAECSEQTFKFTYITSDTSAWGAAMEEMGKVADEQTDGRVTVEGYGSGQLVSGSSQAEVQQTQQGVVDGALISTMVLGLYADPRLDLYNLPFMFPDHETVNTVLDGEGGDIGEEWIREAGLEPLAWGVNGFRQVTNSDRPLLAPKDFQGLQFRIGGGDLFKEAFSLMDAKTVTMSFGELFTALQQGAIDGQENPLTLIDSSSFYDVQDHVTLWNAIYDPTVFVVNPDKYSQLCEEDQDVLREAAAAGAAVQRELTAADDAKLPAELANKGMQVVETDDIATEEFQKVMVEPLYEKWANEIGQEHVDELQRLVDEAGQGE